MEKVRWGVLGAAKIALTKVIPALQRGRHSTVVAIASRSVDRAIEAARTLSIEKAYGSYEELLADKDVEAVYNPLPNALHVPWSARAARARKHVLCEKPIALTASQAEELLAVRDETGVLVQEAFMVRTHPQWLAVRDRIRKGHVGELRAIQGFFSYFNRDAENVRNLAELGGGGLLDIGCYPVTLSRFVFETEPTRVLALMERDPEWKVDRLVSGLLDFPQGQSSFVCSTQLVSYQRMQFFGTARRIDVEIPFNTPPDQPSRILLDDGRLLAGQGAEAQTFEACNQYTLQGDLFSKAIRDGAPAPVPLEDAVRNMRVLDALLRSTQSLRWERP